MMSQIRVGSKVEVSEVAVTFSSQNQSQPIFKGLNLEIDSGEIISICGLSGIGKSTFLRVLAGLNSPNEGLIRIDGETFDAPFKDMSLVSQDYSRSLFPWLTVEKNISLPFRGKKVPRDEIRDRVNIALKSVGMLEKLKSYPWQLSGGMQQRVAIARALITRPRLLLLDEPFASVDAYTRLELEDLVLTLTQEIGATTVMVTHDIDEAIYMSDRVVVMSGSPASFTKEIKVNLVRPREQTVTRSQDEFLNLRDELYRNIRT
jgi:NitT/TauT family transport system ATP-binding protein